VFAHFVFHLLLAFANLDYSSCQKDMRTLYIRHFCIVWIAGNEPVFNDKKVMLLEAAAQRKQYQLPDSYNSRVCALSGGTVRLLKSMSACYMFVSRINNMQTVFNYVVIEIYLE